MYEVEREKNQDCFSSFKFFMFVQILLHSNAMLYFFYASVYSNVLTKEKWSDITGNVAAIIVVTQLFHFSIVSYPETGGR